jgi:ribosomal protein L11 methyltransferase
MGKEYVEVRLAAIVDSGDLLGFLPRSDALGAWESDGFIHVYWRRDRWSPRTLEDLECALRSLGCEAGIAGLSVEHVEDQDWNEAWLRSIKPVQIGSRIYVRQSWNTEPAPPGTIELVIDPKRAFGSGYHATTQLLAEWLADSVKGGESVLDVGTGSGILAMTALRLGAGRALGIDIDPVAIECAMENAALNRFGPELELSVGSIGRVGDAGFDFIVANLDRNSLLALAGDLCRKLRANGRMLLSGLQSADLADVSAAIEARNGRVRETRERDEWLAIDAAFDKGR